MASQRALALADWLMLSTNVPEALLTFQEALVVAKLRWQIEWLFR